MVAVGETISGWKLGRGRGPRLYSGDSRNRRAVCASTVPMVNNLYQGMALDPATGLYYERARWYSPSLGTWISQDPAGYINGANTYQFVESNPAGAVGIYLSMITGIGMPAVRRNGAGLRQAGSPVTGGSAAEW